jgi:hypothetical protein
VLDVVANFILQPVRVVRRAFGAVDEKMGDAEISLRVKSIHFVFGRYLHTCPRRLWITIRKLIAAVAGAFRGTATASGRN